jgi:hypothetical protein
MWFGLINTVFISLASTKRTSAAIADLHACAKDTLKCWPEARWVHVPDHTPKNQKPTATATAITAVSLILPKKMVSGCDVDPRRKRRAAVMVKAHPMASLRAAAPRSVITYRSTLSFITRRLT